MEPVIYVYKTILKYIIYVKDHILMGYVKNVLIN